MAGIDLGICTVAAVAVGDEALLSPGGALKEDDYYFQKERANCDDSDSQRAQRLNRKRDQRRTHFLHAVSTDVVAECGDHGNLELHGWASDRFTEMLEYEAAERGISVENVDERGMSKSCGSCGTTDDSQRCACSTSPRDE